MEEDSQRKAAFEEELKDIQNNLERLKLYEIIPEHFEDAKIIVQANALGVLAAILDLIGQQLAYLHTFGAKFGTTPSSLTLS